MATFCGEGKNEEYEVITRSAPRHGSSPDPDGNMITKLASVLLEHNLVAEENRYILDFKICREFTINYEQMYIVNRGKVCYTIAIPNKGKAEVSLCVKSKLKPLP